MLREDLNPITKNLYCLLIAKTNMDGVCYATNKELMTWTKCFRNYTSKLLNELVKTGYIKTNMIGNIREIKIK